MFTVYITWICVYIFLLITEILIACKCHIAHISYCFVHTYTIYIYIDFMLHFDDFTVIYSINPNFLYYYYNPLLFWGIITF